NVPTYTSIETVEQADAMVARWSAMGPWIDAHHANVRDALARDVVAPDSPVRRVIDELDDLLGRPDADWPLLEPLAVAHADWSAADRAGFADGLTRAAADGIRPAFARYRAFLADELLPRARSDDQPGLGAVPGGAAAYASLVRGHTTTDLDAATIHR